MIRLVYTVFSAHNEAVMNTHNEKKKGTYLHLHLLFCKHIRPYFLNDPKTLNLACRRQESDP